MNNAAPKTPGVIAPPPLIAVGWFVAGLLAERAVPLPRPGARPLGLILGAGAALLAGWAVQTMRGANTPLSPYEPATVLVTQGPFRLTRNPIYLGGTLLYAGLALLLDRIGPLLLLPGLLITLGRGVIEREERYLVERFGEEYQRYQEDVPRWLPRCRPAMVLGSSS